MGQGSCSSRSAPHIVDEEALAFTRKRKGREKRKKGGKKNLDMSKAKCFCHKQGHCLPVPRQEEEEQHSNGRICRGGGFQQELR